MSALRLLGVVALASLPSLAWHVPAHQKVTRAAIRSLPPELQERWAAVTPDLIGQYCLLPDTFRGRQVDREEFKLYCLKPDGKAIHNVQWKREEDIASLTYTMVGLIRAIGDKNGVVAARHAGVLAHFLGDSTCPAHAFMPADSPLANLTDLLPPPDDRAKMNLHTEIERDTPDFDLGIRRPELAGETVADAAARLLDRCYAAIKANRRNMIDLVNAVYAKDTATIDRIRSQGARAGAELLADAYFTAFALADRAQ